MPPPSNLAELLDTRVYPGMIEPESRILRAFIAKHGAEYDEFRFNERVGPGVVLGEHIPEKDRRDWERRTKARPDVIAWREPNQALIIEVKEQATLESIWQVKSYLELYATSFPTHKAVAAIVAATATPAAMTLTQLQGVHMFIYRPKAGDPLAPVEESDAL